MRFYGLQAGSKSLRSQAGFTTDEMTCLGECGNKGRPFGDFEPNQWGTDLHAPPSVCQLSGDVLRSSEKMRRSSDPVGV